MKKTVLLLLSAFFAVTLSAQVVVDFTQRTSAYTPGQKIYSIKGDFQMIGNTNLTLVSYGDKTNNSNNDMKYVDIDSDPTTINSSMATLNFSTENGAVPSCSKIIYAGLYWTGKSHDGGNSPIEFNVGTSTTSNRQDGSSFNGYTLTITSGTASGPPIPTNNGRLATYTFTASGNTVIYRFYSWSTSGNNYHGAVTKQVGSGAEVNVAGSLTSSGNNITFTFTNAEVVNINGQEIKVNSLRRNRSSDSNLSANVTTGGKTLNKRTIKLKHGSQSSYTSYTASSSDIYFPTTSHGQMYSAYVEVTDYVRTHGIGAYYVADMALREGNGGSTGYFGGWGMIVVYENSKMKWRDITIFDGYAYMAGNVVSSSVLEVTGFNTAQSGDITMKLGLIAGEGDVGIEGDYFQILPHNKLTNYDDDDWVKLSHTGNTKNNFFNSSIPSTATRLPNHKNNTGIDIAMFDIDNNNNSIIKNNQTSTKFRYGSTQDTYVISTIAMAVDAYVPDVAAEISIESLDGIPFNSNTPNEIAPGGEMEFSLELKNKGSEPIDNMVVDIPIPFNASYASSIAVYYHSTGAPSYNQPSIVNVNGANYLRWNVGYLPLHSNNETVLAKLSFKLKATEHPMILNNPCGDKIEIQALVSGVGENSGVSFQNLKSISSYTNNNNCSNEPNTDPLVVYIVQNGPNPVIQKPGNTKGASFAPNDNGDESILEFTFCKPVDDRAIPFESVAGNLPAGFEVWSAIYTDPESNISTPAEGAHKYTSTTGFPAIIGTTTYYALPVSGVECYWKIEITVKECNLWFGEYGTDWNNSQNWTANTVPAEGEDVIFATEDNYGVAAENDLYLDKNRTIGNLVNMTTNRALVVTTQNKLIVDGQATTDNTSSIRIQSKVGEGNGALIFTDIVNNKGTKAVVEYDSRSYKLSSGTYPRAWQYIGTPVSGATPASVFGSTVATGKYGSGINVRKYSEQKSDPSDVGDKWEDIIITEPMIAFAGYEVVQPNIGDGTDVHNFAGELNIGDYDTGNLGFTTGVMYRGNYIIANSYTAPIQFHLLDAADFENLEQTIYLYNTGSRTEWQSETGSDMDLANSAPGSYTGVASLLAGTLNITQIPSMSGFLVRRLKSNHTNFVSGGDIKFNFRYDALDKDYNNSVDPMRVNQDKKHPLLAVVLKGDQWSDQVYLASVPGTSSEYDNGWDAYKMRTASVDQIYVVNEQNEIFQTSSAEDINNTLIVLDRQTKNEKFSLRFLLSDMDNLYQEIYLEDLEEKTLVRIYDGFIYNFQSSSNTPQTRFKVHAKKADDGNSDTENLLTVSSIGNNEIAINNNSGKGGILLVRDLTGKQMLSRTITEGVSHITLNLPKGIYIAEVKTGAMSYKQKLIFQ